LEQGLELGDPFVEIAVPVVLEDSLRRHRENLTRLVVSLQSAGVSEAQIEASVTAIVASYKAELMEAIKSMVKN
jgi:hypothetical protein